MSRLRTTALISVALGLLGLGARAQTVGQDLVFTAVQPCRIVDTLFSQAGHLVAGVAQSFDVVGVSDYSSQGGNGAGCGLPGFSGGVPQVQAIFVNLTVASPISGGGHVRAWPTDGSEPLASVINFQLLSPPLNIANGIALPVRQDQQGDDITFKAWVAGGRFIVDVVGYFTRAVRSGDVYLNSQEGDSSIYFFDGGSPTGRSLSWNEAASEFQINGPLRVTGGVSQGSSVSLKTDFRPIDVGKILEGVARLPIRSWTYRADMAGRHLGPTAEAFFETFGLGQANGTIAALDADGVALAAIQGLLNELRAKDERIDELARRIDELDAGRSACTPVVKQPR